MKNELKLRIYQCNCQRCSAVVWLAEQCRANLQFSKERAGRLCELAVVASTGANGMDEGTVVSARREFAKHLNVTLEGPVSNAETPNHIEWAISNSNHNPHAKNPINLGSAHALKIGSRYLIAQFHEHNSSHA